MRLSLNLTGESLELPEAVDELGRRYASEMLDAHELHYIAAALCAYPWSLASDSIVVEIGAYRGGTTVFMAEVLQLLGSRARILSIDPFELCTPDPVNPQGQYAAYLEQVRREGFERTCLPLVGFSADAAVLVPERVGVLVVDGDHRYAGVRSDLELHCAKLRPGGLVFIDDYAPVYPDVVRATDEFFATASGLTLLHKSYFALARRG